MNNLFSYKLRGQVSIEFLVILVIMILLFTAVSMQLTDFSLDNSMQMQTKELMKTAENTILSSAVVIGTQGTGATKTVTIRAPSDCDFSVYSDHMQITSCTEGSFSKTASLEGTNFATMPTGVSLSSAGTIAKGETGLVKITKT